MNHFTDKETNDFTDLILAIEAMPILGTFPILNTTTLDLARFFSWLLYTYNKTMTPEFFESTVYNALSRDLEHYRRVVIQARWIGGYDLTDLNEVSFGLLTSSSFRFGEHPSEVRAYDTTPFGIALSEVFDRFKSNVDGQLGRLAKDRDLIQNYLSLQGDEHAS
jgi:hypothetical protein